MRLFNPRPISIKFRLRVKLRNTRTEQNESAVVSDRSTPFTNPQNSAAQQIVAVVAAEQRMAFRRQIARELVVDLERLAVIEVRQFAGDEILQPDIARIRIAQAA